MPDYRYCGLGLRCDFALPDLLEPKLGDAADLDVRAGNVPPDLDEVTSLQPGLWSRNASEALWELPSVGRVHIRDGGHVIVYQRSAAVDDDTLASFLLEVWFPLAATLRGDFLLRAAAVRLPTGDVEAYAGPSAVGKSTEAAIRLREGANLIADSLLRVTVEADGAVLAHPQAPWLSLWPDMRDWLGWQDRPARRLRPELPARRVLIDAWSEPLPLSRICVLRSREQDAINALAGLSLNRLQSLRQFTAANAWIDAPALRRQHFLWSAAVLNRCRWETRPRSEVELALRHVSEPS